MKKILIVKIGAIGDVIMTFPMLNAIKLEYPNSHITWVVGRSVAPLLQSLNLVDNLVVIDDQSILKGSIRQKIIQTLKVWPKIAFRFFDLKIIAHVDKRYEILSMFCPSRKKEVYRPSPGRYQGYEYLKLFKTDTKLVWPKINLKSTTPKYIAITPGGNTAIEGIGKALRMWPIHHWKELAKLLIAKGHKIAVIGGPNDLWLNNHFKDLNIENAIGNKTLTELMDFYQNCKVVITHDSGPMHIAILSQRPVLGLFGSTIPHEIFPPIRGNEYIWGGENLLCRPCRKGKNYDACSRNLCMHQILPKAVYNKLDSMLTCQHQDQ